MNSNFDKLRILIDRNKYTDEYIKSLLSQATAECLEYTGRESLPNEKYNDSIFNMALCIHNSTSKAPVYETLAKYVIQGYYGGESNVIFVDKLPTYQEKGQIYVIRGPKTSKFYRDAVLIKTITNQDDDSPYTDEHGVLFEDHKIKRSGGGSGTTYTAGTNIEITNMDVINCTLRAGTDIGIVDGEISFTGTIPSYTGGTDIDITNGVISFTGTIPNYTAGTDIDITNGVISFDGDIPNYTAGTDIDITNGVISFDGDIPTYTAGNDIDITNGVISFTGTIPSYTAGNDIDITNGVISFTGTIPSYSAGTDIDITNGVISFDGTIPTDTSDLTNNAGFVTASDVNVKRLTFTNQTVPTSAWTQSGTLYQADITLSGVTTGMVPNVYLSTEDALSGNFAPVADTISGGVRIYALTVPSASITIPVITCDMEVQ